ncbi:MAG: non-lysosomal glucosylceramidase [Kiritimatiellaeota bacterium]|nr:non-lysosomal glucosylceramidase [Kiritimatiellota bacterium]
MRRKILVGLAVVSVAVVGVGGERKFNAPYTGENLNRIAFPVGGIGAGMFCVEGYGAISAMSVRHRMEFNHEPSCFAAVCVLGEGGAGNVARVLEGPIPEWKYFGVGGAGNGSSGRTYGFPRFRECAFDARFPFATVSLKDRAVPLSVELTAWSPFTPPDADASSLPAGALEYRFTNTGKKTVRAVFSFNTRNFMGDNNSSVGAVEGGFVLYARPAKDETRERGGAFAVFVDDPGARVDHCWFRGGGWDALTIAWDNVASGRMVDNPPVEGNAPGASLSVPFELKPGEGRTIRLNTCWYVPGSGQRYGRMSGTPGAAVAAFHNGPSRGGTAGQQPVTGFLGKGLVNTFDPYGDVAAGTLTSPAFEVSKTFVHFLVGGGNHEGRTCVDLLVGGEAVRSATGEGTETLVWKSFDASQWMGKKAQVRIVDKATEGWGHINVDHVVFSDLGIAELLTGTGNELVRDPSRVVVFEDFEGKDFGKWVPDPPLKAECDCEGGCCDDPDFIPTMYTPWYAVKFKSIRQVAEYWRENAEGLRARSKAFSDAFYDTSLPPEVVEAVAANLTILKSPTVLRQHDGRLWNWEGCGDGGGCCDGTCSHVWNYAQAISRLFPSLERGLRRTQFFEGQEESGRQAFRKNLPISPGGGAFDAIDGHCGEIMAVHREWRTCGDKAWLATFWPNVRAAMDYAVRTWDPDETGLPEESHHNTYDINYYGPDGHCGSFYLGALAASARMGEAMGEDVSRYREILARGRARMEKELFNGEYFIQIVKKEGLKNNFGRINPRDQSEAYREIAERVNEEGPKYQYGTGCLSDGVLGFWMARVCGIGEDLVDPKMVRSHLLAVHKYNLKRDLSQHANPQRPSYAMGDDGGLLLCSWPRGGKPLLPFVYSDEVWTGIEYQVASHLIMMGEADKGLEIVRICRKRHDGVRRNPFNEYECGHWYARAMSSYALIEALSGVRYDAVDQALVLRPGAPKSSRSFLSTDTGFGTVTVKGGKASLSFTGE